jgi:biotin transport system substrate-specific component
MRMEGGAEQGGGGGYRRARYDAYRSVNRLIEGHETMAKFAAALTLAVLMGFLAQVRLYTPLTPVPFTMQVFGAALMGGLLGRKWGSISASIYLVLGLVGLPVFAGQMAEFEGMDLLSGVVVFYTSLSAWYIVGFIAMAFVVGNIVDMRGRTRTTNLVVLAPAAIAALLAFAVLEIYVLSNYANFYGAEAGFPNPWFLLAAAGILLLIGASAWLALTTKARRERVELFFGSIVGLMAVYVIGGAGFYLIWTSNADLPALTMQSFLAYTVLPFIPVDVAKVLLAVGLITLVRPTNKELEAAASRPDEEGPSTDVR